MKRNRNLKEKRERWSVQVILMVWTRNVQKSIEPFRIETKQLSLYWLSLNERLNV